MQYVVKQRAWVIEDARGKTVREGTKTDIRNAVMDLISAGHSVMGQPFEAEEEFPLETDEDKQRSD